MIYADFNATYPCQDPHLDMVSKVLKKAQGNPSSIHQHGRNARLILEESREHVARLLRCERRQIFFASGATEANNLALQGVLRARKQGGQPHLLITGGEHPSVAQPAAWLARSGQCSLSIAPLESSGLVNQKALMELITARTRLVSLIYGNNETGMLNPLKEIVREIKRRSGGIHVHVDGVQAFGKTDTSWIGSSGVDSFSASAHKLGGFKGCGFLFLRKSSDVGALIIGGGQESRIRSGTENIPGIISFGLRAKEILANPKWLAPAAIAREHLIRGLSRIPGARIHGDYQNSSQHLGNTVNFYIAGVARESLLLHFDMAAICVSGGAACSSGLGGASPVLLSMGLPKEVAENSIRISFGHSSTPADASTILSVIQTLI